MGNGSWDFQEKISQGIQQAAREDGLNEYAVILVVAPQHFSFTVEASQKIVPGLGEPEGHALDPVEEQGVEFLEEVVEAVSGFRRDQGRAGEMLFESAAPEGVIDQIDLVEDDEGAFLFGAKFLEDLPGRVVLLEDGRLAGVEDMDEEVCEEGLFEGRFEGLDETMGEAPDKTDCVREQQGLSVRQDDAARRGVEGCEEFIFGEDLASG
jgi:hypothetical protein